MFFVNRLPAKMPCIQTVTSALYRKLNQINVTTLNNSNGATGEMLTIIILYTIEHKIKNFKQIMEYKFTNVHYI